MTKSRKEKKHPTFILSQEPSPNTIRSIFPSRKKQPQPRLIHSDLLTSLPEPNEQRNHQGIDQDVGIVRTDSLVQFQLFWTIISRCFPVFMSKKTEPNHQNPNRSNSKQWNEDYLPRLVSKLTCRAVNLSTCKICLVYQHRYYKIEEVTDANFPNFLFYSASIHLLS